MRTFEIPLMPNFTRDPILLTPGPLTTSLQTKAAMLRDWGSWDSHFNTVTREVRAKLRGLLQSDGAHVCVPMQASATVGVEAPVSPLVPRDGRGLVRIMGAYGEHMGALTGFVA